MCNKTKYEKFIKTTYVPIYSQPWWLDAVCGKDNWDVWLYEKGGNILAAMPYYHEMRGNWRYITKAPLTQNNGIIFLHDKGSKLQKRASAEEKIIDAASKWLDEQSIDLYEQQYMHTFNNWQPFFWNGFKCVLRYSYIIEDTSDMERVKENFSAKLRNDIKKGERNTSSVEALDRDVFYTEHEKIFKKQDLPCPFSRDLWNRLFDACSEHNSGTTLCVKNHDNQISSLAYFVWDERYVYLLMGGSVPEFSNENTFSYLELKGIGLAHEKGLGFDFEGSMIKRIAKAFRDFGAVPTPYYRIRKIFNPDIIKMEAQQEINMLREV